MALLDTPLCDFGWAAPPWRLADPSGREHSLADVSGQNGTLVAFVCNHCPYVRAVAERLGDDARELRAHGVETVALMPNDYRAYPADAPDRMREFATASGWDFPYLVDEGGRVAREWGAVCTPDFFGFDAKGTLQYRGRLDDARMSDPSNRTRELLGAMRAIAETGEGPREQHPSMGCSIKWTG